MNPIEGLAGLYLSGYGPILLGMFVIGSILMYAAREKGDGSGLGFVGFLLFICSGVPLVLFWLIFWVPFALLVAWLFD